MSGSGSLASRSAGSEARLGWALVMPAISIIAAVAIFPIGWSVWESLHEHDLRMPWLGRPFVALANYREALGDARFRAAFVHTLAFVVATVTLELAVGLILALVLDRARRARDLLRTAILLPWAIPTVVAALVWRFMFESPGGVANAMLLRMGIPPPTWFASASAAWIPIVLADVWKTTPFVALMLLAALQNIDRAFYEAAAVDGASTWQQFVEVTLPLVRPAILVALLFRTLDAFRVFDAVYVMSGGGPGTSTEPLALYTFNTTLRSLRFGFGAAVSVIIFLVSLVLALVAIRASGEQNFGDPAA